MNLLLSIASGLTAGLVIGAVFAVARLALTRCRRRTPARLERMRRFRDAISRVIKFITFFSLLIGLVWTLYFLALGLADPARAEYANAVSELIVAVLTVIPILFAFFEFLRGKRE